MKLEFIKPHKSASGRKIGSLITPDGSYAKNIPVVRNVGELIDLLQQLPRSLPLNLCGDPDDAEDSKNNGYKPVWYSVGGYSETLNLEENEGPLNS